MSESAERIEFRYDCANGQTWIMRCDRDRLIDAVDAVFRWFSENNDFGPQHLGSFLAAILHDAIAQQIMPEEAYPVVERILYSVPRSDLPYPAKVNMMRQIMRAVLDSAA